MSDDKSAQALGRSLDSDDESSRTRQIASEYGQLDEVARVGCGLVKGEGRENQGTAVPGNVQHR